MTSKRKNTGSKAVHDKIAKLNEQRKEELESAQWASQAAERNSAKGNNSEAKIYQATGEYHIDRSDGCQDGKSKLLQTHLDSTIPASNDRGRPLPKV